ncbi:MAG: nuclear transport factor 2 family protein [Myxococcota bacterium]
MLRSIPPLVLLSFFTALGVPAASVADPVEDRLAIMDALSQYARRWDAKEASAFAALFTEDAVMEVRVDGTLVEGSRVVGRSAILAYARTSHEGRLADRQSRHHFSGLVFLELEADRAVTDHMALITHQIAGETAPEIVMSGTYRNTWRKTPLGWRIHERILSVDRPRVD